MSVSIMEVAMRFMKSLVCIVIVCVLNSYAGSASHPCPIDADLWVLGGQSNMQGFSALKEQVEPNPNILMFNMDNQWMVGQLPLHRIWEAKAAVHVQTALVLGYTPEQIKEYKELTKKTPVGGVGPGYFFAKHLLNNGINAVGLIPSAHGGASMDQWSPALKDKGDDSLYGAMLNRIKMVGGNIKGLLWYQGESDCDGGASALYEEKMLHFIDSIRKDTGISDLPIIYVQIGRYICNHLPESKGIEMQMVREAQRRIASKRKNIYMVTGADLPLDDVVHVSYDGQKILGRRLAELALSYVYEKPNHSKSIDLDSIEVFNDAKPLPYIKLGFKGVSGSLCSQGRPSDFELITPATEDPYIVPYRVEFDPENPSGLILRVHKPMTVSTKLAYGNGTNPYLNIMDEKGIPVPAFGPVSILLNKTCSSKEKSATCK